MNARASTLHCERLRRCGCWWPKTIRALRDVIALGLRDAGYQVDAVERGDDAIDQFRWYDYEVAIIDWRMPGAEGIDVVSWARRNGKPTALLMLTARDAPADRIRGLHAGADDYLVKPFDFGELLARVRALERRPRGIDGPVLEKGQVALDPVSRGVSAGGRPLKLTATRPGDKHNAAPGWGKPDLDHLQGLDVAARSPTQETNR